MEGVGRDARRGLTTDEEQINGCGRGGFIRLSAVASVERARALRFGYGLVGYGAPTLRG